MVIDTEQLDGLPAAMSGERYFPDPYDFNFENTKLDPQHFDDIPRLLKAGGTKEMAASMAGVGRSTFYRWLDRGERNVESGEPIDR